MSRRAAQRDAFVERKVQKKKNENENEDGGESGVGIGNTGKAELCIITRAQHNKALRRASG